jgi:hypothetical protein
MTSVLWQENDVLYALCAWHGENAGGWIVGKENYQRWVISPEPIALTQSNKIHHYQRLAEEALAGELVGSSAGGEQPKFACYVQTPQGNRHVLVKFSAREKNMLSERWGISSLPSPLRYRYCLLRILPPAMLRLIVANGDRYFWRASDLTASTRAEDDKFARGMLKKLPPAASIIQRLA